VRTPKRPKLLELAVWLISAVAVIWGATRAIGYGEQQPARALVFFGSIVLVVLLASWLEERQGVKVLRRERDRESGDRET
jgi:hypothetical protein